MKFLFALALCTLAFSPSSFAVSFQGIEKNVVMSCGKGDATVWILSDKYTSASATAPDYDDQKLTENPGQMYVLRGKMIRSQDNQYSIRSMDKMQPLELTRSTGIFDKTKGVYENDQYRLDLHSRQEQNIILIDKAHDKELACHVEGDCC